MRQRDRTHASYGLSLNRLSNLLVDREVSFVRELLSWEGSKFVISKKKKKLELLHDMASTSSSNQLLTIICSSMFGW